MFSDDLWYNKIDYEYFINNCRRERSQRNRIYQQEIFYTALRSMRRGEEMAARAGTESRKKTSTQRQKEEEKREKAGKLTAQRSALQSRLAAVDALRSGFTLPDLTGAAVEHTQYGSGTVEIQQDAVLTVRYGTSVKKQKLPFVVAGGFMHLQDAEMETQLSQMDDLNRQKDSLEKEIQYLNSLLSDLEKT